MRFHIQWFSVTFRDFSRSLSCYYYYQCFTYRPFFLSMLWFYLLFFTLTHKFAPPFYLEILLLCVNLLQICINRTIDICLLEHSVWNYKQVWGSMFLTLCRQSIFTLCVYSKHGSVFPCVKSSRWAHYHIWIKGGSNVHRTEEKKPYELHSATIRLEWQNTLARAGKKWFFFTFRIM